MGNGPRRFYICFGLVTGTVLLVLLGVVGGLHGAAVAYDQEFTMPEMGSAWVALADRPVPSASTVVTELQRLPIIMQQPSTYKWLTIWTEPSREPMVRALAEASEREFGVHLSVRVVENIHEAILRAARVGWGPDLFVGLHDHLIGLHHAGVLVPIHLGSRAGDFVPSALDGFSINQQLYGLPYASENMALFRNVDLVPDAPQSWEELMAEGQALQQGGQVSYTLALEDNGYKIYPLATSYGGYVFGRVGSGAWITADLGISGTGMISAGNWISGNVGAGLIPPVAHDGNGAETLFETGHVPFVMTGPWALARFRNAGVNYAISAFPSGGSPFIGVYGFMINAHSPRQWLAKEFLLEFVARREIMNLLYQYEQRPPVYKPLLDSLADPDVVNLVDAGSGGEPIPTVPEMGCVWGPWNAAVVRIITLVQKPEEALIQAADEIGPCIRQEYKGMVNVPGNYQVLAGCAYDWDPACMATAMSKTNGLYVSSHALPAGNYEVKVALHGSWEENYGLGGVRDGANIPFSLPSAGLVEFTFDPESHILSININS